jgi:hypothetical protein
VPVLGFRISTLSISYLKRLREKGNSECKCPCGGTVSLAEPKKRIHFWSEVEAMGQSADRQRDFDAFVVAAKGETSTKSSEPRNTRNPRKGGMKAVFAECLQPPRDRCHPLPVCSRFILRFGVSFVCFVYSVVPHLKGREIKTIGGYFMAAFKCAGAALDYARTSAATTGWRGLTLATPCSCWHSACSQSRTPKGGQPT